MWIHSLRTRGDRPALPSHLAAVRARQHRYDHEPRVRAVDADLSRRDGRSGGDRSPDPPWLGLRVHRREPQATQPAGRLDQGEQNLTHGGSKVTSVKVQFLARAPSHDAPRPAFCKREGQSIPFPATSSDLMLYTRSKAPRRRIGSLKNKQSVCVREVLRSLPPKIDF